MMIERKDVAIGVNDLMHEFCEKLNDSIIDVRDKCSDEEFINYRKVVSVVIGEIFLEILNPLYKKHPDLKPKSWI